jgi:excisionase family DNA binding protein
VQDAVQDAGMDDRMTVAEAAERLSITKEAVRKRIHRGTLRSDRAADGTVMVYVPPSDTPDGTPSSPERDLLYEEMRERIRYLERQVEEEREARRRADTLLARLMDRVPELEPPVQQPAPSQASEDAAQELADGSGAQNDAAERVSWWRRVFGG